MTQTASVFARPTNFDAFLQAEIGDDGNGMLLSVLSALARSGLDPWHEAAELAKLPREAAVQKLASVIAALPQTAPTKLDAGAIAARLVGLLSRGATSASAPANSAFSSLRAIKRPSALAIFAALLALMLAAQYLLGSHR